MPDQERVTASEPDKKPKRPVRRPKRVRRGGGAVEVERAVVTPPERR